MDVRTLLTQDLNTTRLRIPLALREAVNSPLHWPNTPLLSFCPKPQSDLMQRITSPAEWWAREAWSFHGGLSGAALAIHMEN